MDDKQQIEELEDRISQLEKRVHHSFGQAPLKLLAIVLGFFGAMIAVMLVGALIKLIS